MILASSLLREPSLKSVFVLATVFCLLFAGAFSMQVRAATYNVSGSWTDHVTGERVINSTLVYASSSCTESGSIRGSCTTFIRANPLNSTWEGQMTCYCSVFNSKPFTVSFIGNGTGYGLTTTFTWQMESPTLFSLTLTGAGTENVTFPDESGYYYGSLMLG